MAKKKAKSKSVERKVQSAVDKILQGGASSVAGPGRSSQRLLLDSRIPKSSFRVSGGQAGMVIKGTEILDELRTSKIPLRQVVNLNPAAAGVFPRLSGFALQFERYRFRRLRLCYYPACPATRSGAVGLAIFTQYSPPNTGVPTFLPEFGSFEYAAVGTVASAMATPWWSTRDPEMFFTGSGGLSALDPLKVYQASLAFVTRDALTTENELIAGYVSIEYEVEFFNFRPTIDKFALAGSVDGLSGAPTTLYPGGGALVSVSPGPVRSAIGSHPLGTAEQWAAVAPHEFTGAVNGFLDAVAGVSYVWSWLGKLAGVSADQKSAVAPAKPPCRGPALAPPGCVVVSPSDEPPTIWVNPALSPWIEGGDSKYTFEDAVRLSSEHLAVASPAVAGDYSVTLRIVPMWSGAANSAIAFNYFGNALGAVDPIPIVTEIKIPHTPVGANNLRSEAEEQYSLVVGYSGADALRVVTCIDELLIDKANQADGSSGQNL